MLSVVPDRFARLKSDSWKAFKTFKVNFKCSFNVHDKHGSVFINQISTTWQ